MFEFRAHGYIIPREVLVPKGNKIKNLSLLLNH